MPFQLNFTAYVFFNGENIMETIMTIVAFLVGFGLGYLTIKFIIGG